MIDIKTRLKTYDFEMFSTQGNKACQRLVSKVLTKIEGKTRIDKEQLIKLCKESVKNIKEKHSEVNDSEPEYHITLLINRICSDGGYNYEIQRGDIF